ncbi:MAG: glycosyltransferase [Desulfuromonadales bacterium]
MVDSLDLIMLICPRYDRSFSAAYLFLMPSTAEAFGMMAIEAMACGTPVVVCEGTALADVVYAPHGGIAVPQHDSDRLAAEIGRLMIDEQERQQLGRSARDIAKKHYDLADHVRKMTELYQEVAEKWES